MIGYLQSVHVYKKKIKNICNEQSVKTKLIRRQSIEYIKFYYYFVAFLQKGETKKEFGGAEEEYATWPVVYIISLMLI